MGETILLTGGTGFVGRNFILRAIADGREILAPVRNPDKLRDQLAAEGIAPDRVRPLPADPAQWGGIRPAWAVLSAGVLFARDRDEYFRTNVAWNLDVLRALPPDCQTVVLSSLSAGGPTPPGRPARTESDPDSPLTWYGESKLALESAVGHEFSGRSITILRPPMILGPRDAATVPLFQMARGLVRTKPGFRDKAYSFLAVDDVVSAILAALERPVAGTYYIAGETVITDRELIASAAHASGGRGVTLPLPQALIGLVARFVDAIPKLRAGAPSLTRDRVREIWPDRWVVDASAFRRTFAWQARISLDEALAATWHHLRNAQAK